MSTKDGNSKLKRHQKKLFRAVIRGDVKLLQDVLAGGHVDVNAYDIDSRTPLMHGVVLENTNVRVPITHCLLNAGADTNAKDADGKTALMYAVSDQDNDGVITTLLGSRRTDPNLQDLEGNTALMHAVNCDNVTAIQSLVDKDSINTTVDVKLTNKHGYSALLMAVKFRRSQCCRVLVKEAKADPNDVAKHWQGTLARLLEGDAAANGKKTAEYRGRRSTTSLRLSANTPLMDGSLSYPRLNSASSARGSLLNSHNAKSAVPRSRRPIDRGKRNSGLRKSSCNDPEGYPGNEDKSPDKETERPKDMLNSLELHTRPSASREHSNTSLYSESTVTIDLHGRPRAVREGSDSSIDTISTLQTRPNTRQDSNLSIFSLEGSMDGRKFPRQNSAVFRRGYHQTAMETRTGRRTSWSRPSSSILLQPMIPWSIPKDNNGWLNCIPRNAKDHVQRTVSSMSSYKHGTPSQPDRLAPHQPRLFTGRSAKETALKHIRGSLRIPVTPTPPAHRVFSREDKALRHLPAISGSKP